jgi:hypothetical protein
MSDNSTRRFLGVPDEFWIGFVIMVGFFLKLVYDIQVGYTSGTSDAGVWKAITGSVPNSGHIGVIQYYFTYHTLPDFDMRTISEYANPPFFYIVCALFLEVTHRLLGWAAGTSLHLAQCLNVIYVFTGSMCGVSMVHRFGVKRRKMVIAILLLTFFPFLYNLSASLDPSAMAFMFSMLVLNGSLIWYRSRKHSDFLKIGLFLGLGLMTSFMVILTVPSGAVLYYYAGRDGRRTETPLAVQLRHMLVVVLILGGFWPLYRLIRFGILPDYSTTANGSRAFLIENYGALKRLALPSPRLLRILHMTGVDQYEYNIWAQIFKTALFDFHAMILSFRYAVIAAFLIYQHHSVFSDASDVDLYHVYKMRLKNAEEISFDRFLVHALRVYIPVHRLSLYPDVDFKRSRRM